MAQDNKKLKTHWIMFATSLGFLALVIAYWRFSRLINTVNQAHEDYSLAVQKIAADKIQANKEQAYKACRENLTPGIVYATDPCLSLLG